MPSYKVVASVMVSCNLDIIVGAADDEVGAQKKVEQLLKKLNLNLCVEKGDSEFTKEESEAFDSMEQDLHDEEREVVGVEEIED